MQTIVYAHIDKSSNYEEGKRLGLSEKALDMFIYACYEVALGLDINEDTGEARIVSVDGRKVEP